MLPALLAIVLVLFVLVLLPYDRPRPVLDEEDGEEPSKVRLKPTRQR